jgi:hypothetical protein
MTEYEQVLMFSAPLNLNLHLWLIQLILPWKPVFPITGCPWDIVNNVVIYNVHMINVAGLKVIITLSSQQVAGT